MGWSLHAWLLAQIIRRTSTVESPTLILAAILWCTFFIPAAVAEEATNTLYLVITTSYLPTGECSKWTLTRAPSNIALTLFLGFDWSCLLFDESRQMGCHLSLTTRAATCVTTATLTRSAFTSQCSTFCLVALHKPVEKRLVIGMTSKILQTTPTLQSTGKEPSTETVVFDRSEMSSEHSTRAVPRGHFLA